MYLAILLVMFQGFVLILQIKAYKKMLFRSKAFDNLFDQLEKEVNETFDEREKEINESKYKKVVYELEGQKINIYFDNPASANLFKSNHITDNIRYLKQP